MCVHHVGRQEADKMKDVRFIFTFCIYVPKANCYYKLIESAKSLILISKPIPRVPRKNLHRITNHL